MFYSQAPEADPRTPPKYGQAAVDPRTGQFDSVTTYDYQDGLIVGEHKVVVQCLGDEISADAHDKSDNQKLEGQAGPAEKQLKATVGIPVDKLVPPEFSDRVTTPLIVNTNKLPLEIKVPKPN